MSLFGRAAAERPPTPVAAPATLDLGWLDAHPLPPIDPEGDKEGRGHVLVVGGSSEIPGAVILAATAALRAGAGKLSLLTDPACAPWVATVVPESRTIRADGGWAKSLLRVLKEGRAGHASHAGLLIGPGMEHDDAVADAVETALEHAPKVPIVLDAAAICTLRRAVPKRGPRRRDAAHRRAGIVARLGPSRRSWTNPPPQRWKRPGRGGSTSC